MVEYKSKEEKNYSRKNSWAGGVFRRPEKDMEKFEVEKVREMSNAEICGVYKMLVCVKATSLQCGRSREEIRKVLKANNVFVGSSPDNSEGKNYFGKKRDLFGNAV